MPNFLKLTIPALAAFVFGGFAASAAQAQVLYLGYNSTTGSFADPGTAFLSAAGTTASGAFTFNNSNGDTVALNHGQTSYQLFQLYNTSSAVISGGTLDSLHTDNTSSAVISGGTVNSVYAGGVGGDNSLVTISGGNVSFLESFNGGVINILGSNLVESNTITTIYGADYYTVSGTLLNSRSPFTADYMVNNASGTLEFNGKVASPAAVPEASSVMSFGLLLALAGLGIAARRFKPAAR